MITVKMIRSAIGCNPKQRATLKALGLKKIRQEKQFEDSGAVRGMVKRVEHLVEVTSS